MARRTMLDMLDIWFGSIASMAFPEDISQYIPQSGGRDHVPGVGQGNRIWIFHSRITSLDVDLGDISRIRAEESRHCEGDMRVM